AGADVNVSGASGGGEALVGGGWQGGANTSQALQYGRNDGVTAIIADPAFDAGGYVRTADIAYVDAGARIDASATDAGDGGRVVVWADAQTTFHGAIAAQGAGGGVGGN